MRRKSSANSLLPGPIAYCWYCGGSDLSAFSNSDCLIVMSPALMITGSAAAAGAAGAFGAAGLSCAIAIVAASARAIEIVVVFFTQAPSFRGFDR